MKYAVVTVMDQTIGYDDGTGQFTTKGFAPQP